MKLLFVALLFVADFAFASSRFDIHLKFLARQINRNKKAFLVCLKKPGVPLGRHISTMDVFDADSNGIITVDEIKEALPRFKKELPRDKHLIIFLISCTQSYSWTPESEVGETKMEQLADMITADKTPNKSASKEAFARYAAPIENLMCKLDGSIKVEGKKEKPDNIISAAEIRQMWSNYSDWGEYLGDDIHNIDKAIKFLNYCDHETFTCANGKKHWKAKCCLYTANASSDPKNVCPKFEGCINNKCEPVYEEELAGAAADKGTWTLQTEGTSCDERPQKYFNKQYTKEDCQTSCHNEEKGFKFAQRWDDNFCACFKTCAFNSIGDAKLYGYGIKLQREVKKCTRCSCKSFDKPTKTYSQCSAVPTNSECSRGYCVKCESDGTTPMPGNYLKHAAECVNYENGSLSSETKVGKLQRLLDLLEAMEA
jgi:hypothetical protein